MQVLQAIGQALYMSLCSKRCIKETYPGHVML